MPSPSSSPEHVYIGYVLRETEKDGKLIYKPFHVKAKSFKKAKHWVETDLVDRPKRVPAPGVLVYLQKTPHDLIAANNVKAFFTGPSTKDVYVGRIVTSGDRSEFIPEPKKASKPRKLKTKRFLGHCLVNANQISLVISATGYMKARERGLRLAAAVSHDDPSLTLLFYLRNQIVEYGKKPEELLRAPYKQECLVRITPTKDGPSVYFPPRGNENHRPHQRKKDRDVFMIEKLDRIVTELKSQIAPLIEKAKRGTKIGS